MGHAAQRERARLGLGDVHHGREDREHGVGLLDGVGERLALAVGAGDERALGTGAQARQRRPEVVRGVVERAAHPVHERLDTDEHAVDEAGELVEVVARAGRRHALAEATGLGDAPRRVRERAHGRERTAGQERAAAEGDEQDRQRDDPEEVAEPLEHLGPRR